MAKGKRDNVTPLRAVDAGVVEQAGVAAPDPVEPERRSREWMPVDLDPKWIEGPNQRNLNVMMDVLAKGAGEGRLGAILGTAGRGKTTSVRRMITRNAHQRWAYLFVRSTWKRSELGLLQGLARELGVSDVPRRKDPCFSVVLDRLITHPRPVFIDEAEKIPRHLDVLRELAEGSTAAIVLVGEPVLAERMFDNKRVWSRTFQALKFAPLGVADVILYVEQSSGLEIEDDAAVELHGISGGDWRPVRRTLIDVVEIANQKRTRTVTKAMVTTAVQAALTPMGSE